MSEAIIALLAAVFGGAGLKAIEALLSRSKERADVATQIRDELRVDVATLRADLKALSEALDEWKARYYRLLVGFNELKYKLLKAGHHEDIEEVESKMEDEEGQYTAILRKQVEEPEG